jgi:acyl dehydratase
MRAPPPYRVRAHNAADRRNPIHADDVARRHGYRGGLVPGVTVFGYLTRPVVEAFGRPWLERGEMTVRFRRPCYEGDMVTATAAVADDASRELLLRAVNDAGVECAAGRAALRAVPPAPPPLEQFPVAPCPEPLRGASREVLAAHPVLGTVEAEFRSGGPPFLGAQDDDLELYARERLAHPAWLLRWANEILAANVRLGPWIHTASTIENLRPVRDGDRVSTRARVVDLYEQKGHELVDLDVLLVVGDAAVARIRHTAIYRLRQPTLSSAC